jgi:hypothetical protein
LLTLLLMAAVGYAYLREGLFTAFCMFINVLAASLVAFNFYEPLATALESSLKGYEDCVSLIALFFLTLAPLRWLTNSLAHVEVHYEAMLTRAGGVFFGVLTGYLVAGFLVFALQTLPWQENFLGYEVRYETGRSIRHVLPADQVWLGLMYRAHEVVFGSGDDKRARLNSLEIRYAYFRRHTENFPSQPWKNQKDDEIIQGLKKRRDEEKKKAGSQL